MKWLQFGKAVLFFSSPVIVGVVLTESAQLYAHRPSNIAVCYQLPTQVPTHSPKFATFSCSKLILFIFAGLQSIQQKREELLLSGAMKGAGPDPQQLMQVVSDPTAVDALGTALVSNKQPQQQQQS